MILSTLLGSPASLFNLLLLDCFILSFFSISTRIANNSFFFNNYIFLSRVLAKFAQSYIRYLIEKGTNFSPISLSLCSSISLSLSTWASSSDSLLPTSFGSLSWLPSGWWLLGEVWLVDAKRLSWAKQCWIFLMSPPTSRTDSTSDEETNDRICSFNLQNIF